MAFEKVALKIAQDNSLVSICHLASFLLAILSTFHAALHAQNHRLVTLATSILWLTATEDSHTS